MTLGVTWSVLFVLSLLFACQSAEPQLDHPDRSVAPSPVISERVSEESLNLASAAWRARRATEREAANPHAVVVPRPGALTGRRIAISPGHGYRYADGEWSFQRGVVHSLREDFHTNQWAIDNMKVEQAWAELTQIKEIVVAVIDSGVQYDHPDLVNRMWVNPGEIPGDGIDNDGNGYIDDVRFKHC